MAADPGRSGPVGVRPGDRRRRPGGDVRRHVADSVTVFAPTNDAIADIAGFADLAADQTALQQFVLAQVVDGSFTAEQLWLLPVTPPAPTPELTALSGDVLVIDPVAQTVNSVPLLAPVDPADLPLDRPATNGMVHAVDTAVVVPVITPPTTAPATEPPAPHGRRPSRNHSRPNRRPRRPPPDQIGR